MVCLIRLPMPNRLLLKTKEPLINPLSGAGCVHPPYTVMLGYDEKGTQNAHLLTCKLRFFVPFCLAIIHLMNESEAPQKIL